MTGVVTELYGQGYKEYYTGMASGFDMTAAEAVLQVRERYEDIKLIAAVPFRETALVVLKRKTSCCMPVCWKGWTGWSWFRDYHKGCYLRRDEYMVHKADTVIAYWDLVPKGGTFYTVNKALESGKSVINLYEKDEIAAVCIGMEKRRSVKAGQPSHFAIFIYTLPIPQNRKRARCFLRSSFFAFCCFFLTSISAIICFKGLTVSGFSRLNRLK